tara:strand:+ start:16609 stop:18750 length:2142 start_codon:yes stop_codon:yes gene_type:complete
MKLKLLTLTFVIFVMMSFMNCSETPSEHLMPNNPFFEDSPLPFSYPQFDRFDDSVFLPAFETGFVEQLAEIDEITKNPDPANFENTVVALEKSGRLLDRVQAAFFNLTAANTNETLEKINSEIAPKLSAHSDHILLNSQLFERIKNVYENRQALSLDQESLRLVEEYYVDFVRAGALLSSSQKERLRVINADLASLQTTFGQNVLSEVNDSAVLVETREELRGLSPTAITAAANAADARGFSGKYLISLLNTSGQPILQNLENRSLREQLMQTSLERGSRGGDFDNRSIVAKIASLRAERAMLLGYTTHAEYSLERQTAGTVSAVNGRLAGLAPTAVSNARREARDLQTLITSSEEPHSLQQWDWSYYTEKLRSSRYDFDATELRPYLELNNVLFNGVFYAANRLYGISFKERTDLPVYHPDVRVFDIIDHDEQPLGLFLIDYYARPSKRGGAWMNAFVSQSSLLDTKPIIINCLNITKPPDNQSTLLTFDEVETMFHEFGHALHGIFSSVRYPYFSGTSVPRDFVEYPSQVNEMWAIWPEVLQNYAVHFETGEPMPEDLLDRLLASETFNQGFATTEYLAASLLDQAWHQLTQTEVPEATEVMAFEEAALEKSGIKLDTIPPRYRTTYFSHIWSGGYAAGYYSYIWSEVLDADTVEWFREKGGLSRENGTHFRQNLLSKGGSEDAMELYRNFRGREPDITPLLKRRGLDRSN